ncbi:MAG: ComF family protein [Gammaproteobacteria bacterium]|uniref:ComF family protein n=1 Tax=Pseudacidovorax sp. TaxID=1934311 RepID=UPI001B3FB234|nr:ComF family protein [Pseudacidovorax sp.]MBP6894954.1 ComF family protein [Pseudacidovorax sp.]
MPTSAPTRLRLPAARLFSALLDLLPSQCALCRAWPDEVLCRACLDQFAVPVPRCRHCALAVPPGQPVCGACLRDPPPLDECVAACDYDWPWSACVSRFKFAGEAGWAAPLAAVLRRHPRAADLIDAADLVLPMPLSQERLRERGFNQSLELARRLAPGRCNAHVLLRPVHTLPQSGLSRADRLRNLRGAFAVEPARAHGLRGRAVLLVDDVMTTGASLSAAARVLRQAGAAQVTALVLARTPAPGDA